MALFKKAEYDDSQDAFDNGEWNLRDGEYPEELPCSSYDPRDGIGVDNSELERGNDIGCHRSAEGCDEDDQILG